MPKGVKIAVRKNLAVKRDLIRRANVKRHNEFAARIKLKSDQFHAQHVATMQQEFDRLYAASIHGSGLDGIRMKRMTTLK